MLNDSCIVIMMVATMTIILITRCDDGEVVMAIIIIKY
jgi:hypothetical protein